MGCLPKRGGNPRALASGLSYVQVDKNGITILYHLHQCRPFTSRDISAKVGKGGIKSQTNPRHREEGTQNKDSHTTPRTQLN